MKSPGRKLFVSNYSPSSFDIVCGRGRGCFLQQANKVYISTLREHIHRYISAKKRAQKTALVSNIVSSLQAQGFHFLKQDYKTQRYYELTENEVYERTAHALRDLIRKHKKNPQETKPGTSVATENISASLRKYKNLEGRKAEAVSSLERVQSNIGDIALVQSDVIVGHKDANETAETSFDIFFQIDSGDFKEILDDIPVHVFRL